MKKSSLKTDINVVIVQADVYPMGVEAAFNTLHAKVPVSKNRQNYGISHGNTEGGISYWAAAQILPNDPVETWGLETYTIKKGAYLSENLKDYKNNLAAMGPIFQKLLHDPRLHPEGYCLEIYSENDVKCMVRLAD
jgi:hypothetical protein